MNAAIKRLQPIFFIDTWFVMRIFAFILRRMDKKSEEFYARLKQELTDSTLWPSEYLFKFIVPSLPANVEKVEKSFDNMGAVIETTQSKTGKYTAVSVNVRMVSAQSVIDKYIELSEIEGIISL